MAFLANGGTVSLSTGSAQSVGGAFPLVFNNLTVSNSAGAALTADVTVNAVLSLNNGTVTTNGNVLYVSSTGSVTRTNGHVVGALTKYVPAGSPSVTFEIGDAALFAPVTLAFNSVAGGGDVAASTTPTEHPQLAASSIDGSLSVNRYWVLAGPAISYSDYAATFNFNGADLDAGTNTADFIAARYADGTWASQATTTATATYTSVSGVVGFGDFAVGTPRRRLSRPFRSSGAADRHGGHCRRRHDHSRRRGGQPGRGVRRHGQSLEQRRLRRVQSLELRVHASRRGTATSSAPRRRSRRLALRRSPPPKALRDGHAPPR